MSSSYQSTRTSQPSPTWMDHVSQGIGDHFIYARKLLATGSAIASLVPSTRWTARAMLQGIDFNLSPSILELGAGTGPITAELVKHASEKSRCLIVERDHEFCELLRSRFPSATIIESDALALDWILDQHGVSRIDHVLSEIPVGWLPPITQDMFLKAVCRRLAPGGSFRQLTHLPGAHLPLYRRYFHDVRMQIELRNLPPAACYVCEGPRGW